MKISTQITIALIIVILLSLFAEYLIDSHRTSEVIIRSLEGNLPDAIVKGELENSSAKIKASFFLSPIFIILKILILSTIVWVGYTFQHESGTEVEYVVFFLSGTIAEGAIVLMNFVKFFVLNTSDSLLTLKVIKHYVPLSGLDFVDLNVISFPLLIILKNISLFHILYLLLFSYSFGKLSCKGFSYSSNLVIISLSLGMLIYLLIKVSIFIIL